MNKISFIIIVFISLLFTRSILAQDEVVRVAIKQDAENLRATVKGPYRIVAVNSYQELEKSDKALKYNLVTANNSGIKIGNEDFKVFGVELIPLGKNEVYINGIPYKGSVTFIRKENLKILAVNNVELQDYLKGVLFHEVSHLWPMETLKAQAVAARTFVLYQKQVKAKAEYDVTSDVYSQVYGGSYSERERPNQAVESTKGEYLSFKGEIFPAYYHAVCAGQTEDASVLWKTDIAPLKGGVKCDYCRFSHHDSWTTDLKTKEVQDKLNAYGIKTGAIKQIEISSFTKNQRVAELSIMFENGEKISVSAKDFRYALGPNLLKSTNFTIKHLGDEVLIVGQGWGHGVGMCQWGAFFLGARGMNYKEILQFYYPGAELKSK